MGYHTLHFFSGFMGDPTGQLKSLAKSSLFDMGPRILYLPGECAPVSIWDGFSAELCMYSRYLFPKIFIFSWSPI